MDLVAGRVARFFNINILEVENLPYAKVTELGIKMGMLKAEEKLEKLPLYDFPHIKQKAREKLVNRLEIAAEKYKEKQVSSKEEFAKFLGQLNG